MRERDTVNNEKVYSLYLSRLLKIMVFGQMASFFLGFLGLAFAIIIPSNSVDSIIVGGVFLAFVIFFGAFSWYWILSVPYKIAFTEDGTITFTSLVRRKSMNASNIRSIKPEYGQIGFLVFRTSRGKVRILNQFDNFHELVVKIKELNNTIAIRGC